MVCVVAQSIFIDATPVEESNDTFGLSNSEFNKEKVFVNDWYKIFVKKDLSEPALPVIKIEVARWKLWIGNINF